MLSPIEEQREAELSLKETISRFTSSNPVRIPSTPRPLKYGERKDSVQMTQSFLSANTNLDKNPTDKYNTISFGGQSRRKNLLEQSFLKNENSTRTRDNNLISQIKETLHEASIKKPHVLYKNSMRNKASLSMSTPHKFMTKVPFNLGRSRQQPNLAVSANVSQEKEDDPVLDII